MGSKIKASYLTIKPTSKSPKKVSFNGRNLKVFIKFCILKYLVNEKYFILLLRYTLTNYLFII